MTVPYTFGTATTSIPLSNLDANFNTPITLGNTSIYLGNTTTTIGNLTLTNATISSGTVNITNVTVTTANVTNITVTGTANIATGNITTLTSTSITDSGLTSGRVTYAGASGLLSDSATLTYNGTTLTASTGANFATTSGNVGIGTSSPVSKLDVTGQVTATGGIFKANGAPSLSAATAGEAILAPESSLGALLYGNGTTYDVVLGRRTTNVALGVLANTVNLFAGGTIQVTSTISVGNVTPSASGSGVTFPATQSASSDANTLDDYEEGTWTATLTPLTSGSITLSASTCAYTKVGRSVTVTGQINTNAVSSPLGRLRLGGLPFTSASGTQFESVATIRVVGGVAIIAIDAVVANSGSFIDIYPAGTSTDTYASNINASTSVVFSATYFA